MIDSKYFEMLHGSNHVHLHEQALDKMLDLSEEDVAFVKKNVHDCSVNDRFTLITNNVVNVTTNVKTKSYQIMDSVTGHLSRYFANGNATIRLVYLLNVLHMDRN